MDLIEQFIASYRRQYDYYEQTCRIAAQILDAHLQSVGVRSIVTARAKNPQRLEEKVRQRAPQKAYKTVDEIFEDIVDLAGIRVALYFPGESEEVGIAISELFHQISEPLVFPKETKQKIVYAAQRFSGYWATHYRVRLDEAKLSEAQKRYSEANIEIQVASVLMHAWSEVEHDLVYKPLQGNLSEDEYAILDELNGLVLSGEIALERLQRAGDARVLARSEKYENHYDLATSLLEMCRKKLNGQKIHSAAIGRVDLLFKFLTSIGLDKPGDIVKYVEALDANIERRPLVEQITEQILAQHPEHENTYRRIRLVEGSFLSDSSDGKRNPKDASQEFFDLWKEFTSTMRERSKNTSAKKNLFFNPVKELENIPGIPTEFLVKGEKFRMLRNVLLHNDRGSSSLNIPELTSEFREYLILVKGTLASK
ncbi:RelA/SpoT domain-containing protein [Herbaspirillum rubrisubalbicans]|uniref:RelA/SpoT domain-containing protein n=1 Tax=Herbaspirillum rubrisubalbicans TaxID=80842 RepID=UPI0015EC39D6|nr:RelA/SpoT domain-containing protein [Herbaspirillum rubrisubalbicans]